MKTFIVTFFLFFSSLTYSQMHYIQVSPKYEKSYDHEEGYFDNSSTFLFTINTIDAIKSKYCTISGYVYDIPQYNTVTFQTGWDYEYLEASTTTDQTGYFEATVSTDNLPRLAVRVAYNGEPSKLKLNNVDIKFSGSKY